MKDNVLSVRLEAAEYDFLLRWALNSGQTLSDIVRMLLRQSMFPGQVFISEHGVTTTVTSGSRAAEIFDIRVS